MGSINVILRDGSRTQIPTNDDLSLMEAIRGGGVDDVLALCGGCCSCATCHVFADPAMDALSPPMSEDENDLLDSSSHRNERSRLSCQIRALDAFDGMTIEVAPED